MKPSFKITSSEGTEFYVTKEFLIVCRNPIEHDNYDLMTNYSMARYLHNERGPAIVGAGALSYWVDGVYVTYDVWNRLSFSTKLTDIVDD